MAENIDNHLDMLAMSAAIQDEVDKPDGFFHQVTQLAPPDTEEIHMTISFVRKGKAQIRVQMQLAVYEKDKEEGWGDGQE